MDFWKLNFSVHSSLFFAPLEPLQHMYVRAPMGRVSLGFCNMCTLGGKNTHKLMVPVGGTGSDLRARNAPRVLRGKDYTPGPATHSCTHLFMYRQKDTLTHWDQSYAHNAINQLNLELWTEVRLMQKKHEVDIKTVKLFHAAWIQSFTKYVLALTS